MNQPMRLLSTVLFLLAVAAPALNAQQAPAAGAAQASKFIEARFAAAEGDFDRALRLIDEVAKANPSDPYVLFERAEMLLEAGQLDRSITELRRVASDFPDFYEAQRLLGRILLDQSRGERNDLTEALNHLRRAYELRPTDTTSGMIVYQVLASLGRLEEAAEIITQLGDRNPDNPIVNYNLATLMQRLGRAEEARSALERVVVSDPGHAPAVLQLVDLYQKAGEWGKAAAALEALEQRDPLNDDLKRQLGYFHLRSGSPDKAQRIFADLHAQQPDDRRHAYFLAEALNDLERYREAEELYRSLVEHDPNDAEFLVSLGLNLMGQRRFDEAAAVFTQLLGLEELAPGIRTLASTQLATIEHFRGDYDDALQRAEAVVRGPLGLNTAAISLVLDVHRKQKNYDEALEFLTPIRAELGDDPAVLARTLEFQLRAGRDEQARETADAVRAIENGELILASVYTDVERFDQALAILEPLYTKDRSDRGVAFQLAATYERAGRIEDAEKGFLDILDRNPEDAATLNYLGYMWADRNENLDRAREMIATAVRLEPRNAAYLDSLGWVHFRLGNLEDAEKYLLEAVQLMPWDPTIQEHLGDLFLEQGEHRKAIEHYEIALRLEPPADEGEKIRTKIAEARRHEGRENR